MPAADAADLRAGAALAAHRRLRAERYRVDAGSPKGAAAILVSGGLVVGGALGVVIWLTAARVWIVLIVGGLPIVIFLLLGGVLAADLLRGRGRRRATKRLVDRIRQQLPQFTSELCAALDGVEIGESSRLEPTIDFLARHRVAPVPALVLQRLFGRDETRVHVAGTRLQVPVLVVVVLGTPSPVTNAVGLKAVIGGAGPHLFAITPAGADVFPLADGLPTAAAVINAFGPTSVGSWPAAPPELPEVPCLPGGAAAAAHWLDALQDGDGVGLLESVDPDLLDSHPTELTPGALAQWAADSRLEISSWRLVGRVHEERRVTQIIVEITGRDPALPRVLRLQAQPDARGCWRLTFVQDAGNMWGDYRPGFEELSLPEVTRYHAP